MTYCLGIILPTGLVLAADSRSNAGVDQVTTVDKLHVFQQPGERAVVVLSAGNLATTQAVITNLRQAVAANTKGESPTIFNRRTLFDVAELVGDTLRQVVARNASFVEPYGRADATFLVAGQIKGEPHRLFQVYAAGNFIEASTRAQFFQLGETKYGKPILDRALTGSADLNEAAKLALLSFDATMRSNVSVAPPIDMIRYEAGSLSLGHRDKFDADTPYWLDLTRRYSAGLAQLVGSLPPPP